MAETHRIFVTVAKGLEELLAGELRGFGIKDPTVSRAGISFQGQLEQVYRVCLWSRVANRVLLPIRSFPASSAEKLYGGTKAIRWSDHLTPKQTIAVDFTMPSMPSGARPRAIRAPDPKGPITNSHFGALKVKDAICDQLRSVKGERPSVDPVSPDLRVNVYLHEGEATVSLDLSGDSLHRRGYRTEAREAPLKENLAAALLLEAGWPQAALEGASFHDPMCGSGTLPIEAALMAYDRAPNLGRARFGFQGWLGHVPALWERLKAEAAERALAREAHPRVKRMKIVGHDRDFRAVNVALANVERAGLHGKVHIEKRELAATEAPGERGVMVVNPPYGERLGEVEELKSLYQALGDTMKQKFKGWRGYVLTSNPDLAKVIGLRATRRSVFFNGAMECRLLKFDLY